MIPTIKNRSEGFTLIELMVAMAISGIIAAAMYGAFQAQVSGQVSQDVSLGMTQSARNVMEMIASDIRMAGCDPTGEAGAVIRTAKPDELVMTMDIGDSLWHPPDGDALDPDETVQYTISEWGLSKGDTNSPAKPLLPRGIGCDALNFVYLDASGNPFVPVTADDRDDINAIQVSIVVRSADAVNPGFLRTYTDNTSYVNLQGDEILPPQNDAFRRFQLSETIDCRNL